MAVADHDSAPPPRARITDRGRPVVVAVLKIRAVRTPDLPALPAIEVAAAGLFYDVDMAAIAEDEPPSTAAYAAYARAGRAWVAVDDAGARPERTPSDERAEVCGAAEISERPVAYLVAAEVDGNLHIEQVSVHPDYARRRIGRSLLDHAAVVARAERRPALTLTTFVHVPWNGPYYARCGFEPLPDAQAPPGLRDIRRREVAVGLDRWPRMCMRRRVTGSALR